MNKKIIVCTNLQMNEFERKLYLKYANIENMTQLLRLKLYRLRLFIQVNALLFLLFYFFKRASGLHMKILSNQLSNSSTNFGLGIKQPEF